MKYKYTSMEIIGLSDAELLDVIESLEWVIVGGHLCTEHYFELRECRTCLLREYYGRKEATNI